MGARIDPFCGRQPAFAPNRRLVGNVRRERDHLLTFLTRPCVEVTKLAGRAGDPPDGVQPQAVGRQRHPRGADTTAVIGSVLTAARQQADPVETLATIRRTGRPPPRLDLTPAAPS